MRVNSPKVRRTLSKLVSTRLLCGASLAVVAVALPSAAHAQNADRHWDANGTTPGNGGAGTWNTSGLNWSPNADGTSGPYATPWNNALLDNAIFGGTGGLVTIGEPITAHNLTFDSTGYTLTGNPLTLSGTTPTITVNSGSTIINSVLVSNAGLTKAGAGALTLNGVNSITGNINLNGGTLAVANDEALGNSSNNIFTAAGTTLNITSGPIGAGRTITLGAGGSTTFNSAGNVIAARFTGAGGLTARGSMTNNANDFTGAMSFDTGTHEFTSIANAGVASSLGWKCDHHQQWDPLDL